MPGGNLVELAGLDQQLGALAHPNLGAAGDAEADVVVLA
jgi:hypothetical protein